MPAYFLISIPRKEQHERRSRIGSIFLHPNFVYMTRGMQCGKIESIGSIAAEVMPEARLGDTLLVHHFVESYEKSFCVAADPDFYYYVVTCMSHNGQNNQTYAVFDGKRILPHPDYIFLETKKSAITPAGVDEYLDTQLQKKESGLLTFKNWTIDKEELVKQMSEIKAQIDSLTKPGMRMTDQVAKVIKEKEAEMDAISKMLNKKRYDLYQIAEISPTFKAQVEEEFHCDIWPGDWIYMLNIACETKMEFNGTEYIVAKTQHFGAPQIWVKRQFNKELVSLSSSHRQ